MVINTIQTFESLNSDVRAKSQAQITILEQDEQETDAKNRTLTNSASELTNPLKMVKKTSQAFESLNSNTRARRQAQISILVPNEHETDAKNRPSSVYELTNPLEMIMKTIQTFESLNSDVRAKSQAQITFLGQDELETDAKNRT